MRWPRTFAVAAAMLTCAVGARAEHEAARRLAKRINVSFVETPLERAVQEVGRLANVAVVVDTDGLDKVRRRYPVSLQLQRTSAREVLDLIAKDAGIGYRLEGLVAFVSTRARALAGEVYLRTFDVRDLTMAFPDFPGPDYTFINSVATGNYGGAMCLEDTPEVMVKAGNLAEMIMSRVNPREWDAALGTSIEERSGRLVVMQTREVHEEIAKLLGEIRASEGIFIRIEATAHLVSTAVVSEALKNTALPGFLTPDERTSIFERLDESGARRLGSARTICLNNQRTHVFSGVISSYVSDADISGAVYDPVVSQSMEGFAMEVRPVASHERRFVTLFVRMESPEEVTPPTTRTVMTGKSMTIATTSGGSWSVSKDGNDVSASGSGSDGTAVTQLAPVRIQTLDIASRHVMTHIQMPNGHAAYFVVPSGVGPRGRSVVLYTIRPRVVDARKGGE